MLIDQQQHNSKLIRLACFTYVDKQVDQPTKSITKTATQYFNALYMFQALVNLHLWCNVSYAREWFAVIASIKIFGV